MTRILDLDLDFFVHGAANWRAVGSGRLDPAEYPPWARDEAISFLADQCKLTHPLPGFVVENHGELFDRWGRAIDSRQLELPLSVSHVDAHSDLGLGDATYVQLLTELLFLPVEERPAAATRLVNDGNYLAFAIACRWLSELTLIRNGIGGGRPADLMPYYMQSFDLDAANIELAAMTRDQFERRKRDQEHIVEAVEPRVPLQHMSWHEFEAPQTYDVICLARSPDYTPADLDPLFEEIRERYIDEEALR